MNPEMDPVRETAAQEQAKEAAKSPEQKIGSVPKPEISPKDFFLSKDYRSAVEAEAGEAVRATAERLQAAVASGDQVTIVQENATLEKLKQQSREASVQREIQQNTAKSFNQLLGILDRRGGEFAVFVPKLMEVVVGTMDSRTKVAKITELTSALEAVAKRNHAFEVSVNIESLKGYLKKLNSNVDAIPWEHMQ